MLRLRSFNDGVFTCLGDAEQQTHAALHNEQGQHRSIPERGQSRTEPVFSLQQRYRKGHYLLNHMHFLSIEGMG